MELRHLRYFVAVAEERNFSRAAERLHMAQSPLSQQIRQLERTLGTTLFTRTTRKVDLTPTGHLLLERARAVLSQVELAARDIRRLEEGEAGRLALGLTGSATYALLPRLRLRLPEVDLEVHGEMTTPDQLAGLRSGALDVAVLRAPGPCDGVDVELLRREPIVAAVPADHRFAGVLEVAAADLRPETFVGYRADRGSALHDAASGACEAAGFAPHIVQEVDETSTLLSLVAAGVGVALVPESVRHLHLNAVRYLRLADATATIDLSVARRRSDRRPLVSHVVDAVRTLVAGDGAASAPAGGRELAS